MLSDAIHLDKFVRGVVLLLGFSLNIGCGSTTKSSCAAYAGYECADAKRDIGTRRRS